jgi:hypothetical protein
MIDRLGRIYQLIFRKGALRLVLLVSALGYIFESALVEKKVPVGIFGMNLIIGGVIILLVPPMLLLGGRALGRFGKE